ncbi:unnamed protein product, partial [Vitis vinifera]
MNLSPFFILKDFPNICPSIYLMQKKKKKRVLHEPGETSDFTEPLNLVRQIRMAAHHQKNT